MKTKKYVLIVLSILMILLVFASSASATDVNATDVLSVDESTSTNNEKLALDYSLDNAVANDTNAVENDEILQNPNYDDVTIKDPAPSTDTWYVNSTKTSSGNGTSPDTAFNTLNDALTNSELQDGNTIMIASGEYKGENNTGLEITKNLNFVKYGDSEAIFDAESQRQIWSVTAQTVNITGLTFKNGKEAKYGGAIYFTQSTDSNINATFINNTAALGGAIYIHNDVSVSGNLSGIFINNTATYGGAIWIYDGNSFLDIIQDSIFINNNNTISVYQGNNVTAINCWFGNNATNYNVKPTNIGNTTINDWLFLNATANPTELNVGKSSTITFKLDSYNDTLKNTSSYDASKMDAILELSQTLGQLNKNTTLIGEEVIYTAKQEGNASVTGKFETAFYTINLKNNEFEPIPTNITVNTTSLDLTVGDIDFINATLDPSEAGGLEVDFNETIIKVEQNEVTREWIVTALAEGKTNITFSFAGSEGYVAAENKTVTVTVNAKPSPSINVVADNLTKYYGGSEQFSVNVTDEEGKGIPDKTVLITINGISYDRTTDENGIARLNINLPSGDYVANVTVDDITVNATVTVLPTVSGSDVRKVYGQKALYNATFLDEKGEYLPNGTEVSFNINGEIQNTNISDDNGLASLNINLPVGNYIVTATNPVTGENASNNITVTRADLNIEANAEHITIGNNATVVVSGFVGEQGSHATGTVTVTAAGKTFNGTIVPHLDGGYVAEIIVPGLNETTIADVNYLGDDNYNPANTTVEIIVSSPDKMNLTISASADPIFVGENATVVVTGFPLTSYGAPSGNVTVTVGDKIFTGTLVPYMIGGLAAEIIVPGLNETTIAEVNYLGDDKYNPANTTVEIIVNSPEKKNLTIKANAEPITAGENATVKVTGLENATGNVSVRAGNGIYFAPIENGEATVIIPGLKENTVGQVSYPGDDNYNNASTTVDITVNPAPDPSKKNLTIKANAEPITAGENATVKVTGLENATGEVSVIANGKTYTAPIKNGEASITIPDLTENTTANVNYKGDDTYNSATTTVNITVNPKGKENATISIDAPSEAPEGDNVTVTVTLPEDATGNITIGNETIPLVNGTASAVLTNLPVGNTTVPITYSGDEKYNPIETEINITVIEDKSINVKAPDVTKYYHGPERFVVNVTDSQGKALANKSVTITINGVTYNRTTNANGTCSLALNLPVGVYNVTTTVENNTVNSVVTIFTTVNGTDVVKVFRNGTQYYATFLDGNGKYLAEGSAVRFNINGVMYDRKVTGDKGLAKLNINLQQGEYIITATNLNTTEMSSNNITVLSRIIENNDLTKYYRNASQYTVKIIGDDGKVVGAGVTVTFNINGVFYTRQTNASGIAKLNINLPAGNYIITAECKECKVSNNIKVLSVLTAQDMVKKYGAPDQFVATLVDGQGNPYARQTVQFNINGVLYNRVTDSAGQAKLNIQLMPGQYIITSSYNGCNIANKITIIG